MTNQSSGRDTPIPNIVEINGFEILGIPHLVVVDLREEKVFVAINHPFLIAYFSSESEYWTRENTAFFGAEIEEYLPHYRKFAKDMKDFPEDLKDAKKLKEEALSEAYEARAKNLN